MALLWFLNLFLRFQPLSNGILSLAGQTKAWQKANRKMNWSINRSEFEKLDALPPPRLAEEDRAQGFIGSVLFYGFGDDGQGNSDAVFSGNLAWEYAIKRRRGKTWQCEYIDFKKPEDIRLRPGAPARPKGFYFAQIKTGERFKAMTVSQLRKRLKIDTGWGPEGFQFLTITHPHFVNSMNERKLPFMALADYDVAPYGYDDFFDAPQLFCSNDTLGLGIGNIDRNYPLFGIPTMQLCGKLQV